MAKSRLPWQESESSDEEEVTRWLEVHDVTLLNAIRNFFPRNEYVRYDTSLRNIKWHSVSCLCYDMLLVIDLWIN